MTSGILIRFNGNEYWIVIWHHWSLSNPPGTEYRAMNTCSHSLPVPVTSLPALFTSSLFTQVTSLHRTAITQSSWTLQLYISVWYESKQIINSWKMNGPNYLRIWIKPHNTLIWKIDSKCPPMKSEKTLTPKQPSHKSSFSQKTTPTTIFPPGTFADHKSSTHTQALRHFLCFLHPNTMKGNTHALAQLN